jgi:hypothetical protein
MTIKKYFFIFILAFDKKPDYNIKIFSKDAGLAQR